MVEISMKIMQAHRLGIIFLLIEANFGGLASIATMDEIVDGIDLATSTPPKTGPWGPQIVEKLIFSKGSEV